MARHMVQVRNRRSAVRVAVTTVVAIATALSGVALAGSAQAALFTDAQIVSGNAFMTNGVVEVGARPNGSFGSQVGAPSGYHPRNDVGSILGFRSDRNRDGWGGTDDDGDFFTPGNPYEAFALKVGSAKVRVNSDESSSISGSYTGSTNTASGQSVSWASSGSVDGISVAQKASVGRNSQVLNVDVTLTNTSDSDLSDIYYARSVDPDNCAEKPSCGDGYSTTNKVESQQVDGSGTASVSASASDGSYIDLRTKAADSRALANYVWYFGTCPSPVDLYDGNPRCGGTQTVGEGGSGDLGLAVATRTPSLAAGASRTFRIQYVLSEDAAEEIDTTVAPTLEPATLEAAHVDETYSASVAADKGTEPITYTVDTGALPDGLELDAATGVITGEPTTAGSTTFTIKATNAKGSDTQEYTIEVAEERVAPTLPEKSLDGGFVRETYGASVAAVLGADPITYTVEDGDLPAGLELDKDTGEITGAPSVEGEFLFTVKASNVKGSDTEVYVIEVGAERSAPQLPDGDLAGGFVGETYRASVGDELATNPVTYEVTVGKLPLGLSVDETGLITGEPTEAGTFTFTVKASNGKGSDTQEYSITVGAERVAPKLPNGDLVGGFVGEEYTASVGDDDATKPVVYKVIEADLPDGLSLDKTTGAITGTPTKAGTFGFTVDAKNGKGIDQKAYTITIGEERLVPALPEKDLAGGFVGEDYSTSVGDDNATKPVTYEVLYGTFPEGLELDKTTGAITGTPKTAGSSTFTILASNAKGADAQEYTIEVGAERVVPSLPTASPGDGKVGTVYSGSVEAVGTKPIGYEVTAGALPEGLVLDEESGAITGTPTKDGTFTFTVTATSGKGADSQAYTITIAKAFVAPGAPGVSAKGGDRRLDLTVKAPASDGGSPITGYEYSLDGGKTWKTLKLVKGKATLTGLKNERTYSVSVRAVNAAGAGEVATVKAKVGWFKDPVSAGKRGGLVGIPKDPSKVKGKARTTKALSTNASGRPAVDASDVRGRHLVKGEAVTLADGALFRFDSAKLTSSARSQIRALVPALADVKAVRCEGYTDYADGVSRKKELSLAKARAKAVCSYIKERGAKVSASLLSVGAKRPVVVGGKASDRAANRRVVITVTK